MTKDIFSIEGPVIGFLEKLGQLLLLSLLWLLGSLPIVTLGTSTTALYYAVIKAVRRGQGKPASEFWLSYKANLGRGIAVTVTVLVLALLLGWNIHVLQQKQNSLLAAATVVCIGVLCGCCVYLCPVMSRFSLPFAGVWKLSFVMTVRYLHYTLAIALGTAAVAAAQFYLLPIPAVLFLPACWCWCVTFLMEKVLLAFMPPKQETDDAWYYP